MNRIAVLISFAVITASPAVAHDLVQLSAGFSTGNYSASVRSDKTGLIVEMLRYYEAAGAKAKLYEGCPACPRTVYTMAGLEAEHAVIVFPKADGVVTSYYQWNFSIPVPSLFEMRGSEMSFFVRFGGAMADVLYTGMSRTLHSSGQTLTQHGEVIGEIYSGTHIFCEKREKAVAICSLSVYRPVK